MKNKKMIFITLTLLWVAVIFSFSLQTGDVSGDLSGSFLGKILVVFAPAVLDNPEQLELFHTILRKCAHFTEFLILAVLARNAMQYIKVRFKGVSAMAFCVAIAAVDETLQLFVSGRAGRVQDVLIDSAGAVAGILVVVLLWELRMKRLKQY